MRRRLVLALITLLLGALAVHPAVAGGEDSERAGRRVFEANCAMCHGGDAGGMMGMHPSLRGAVERLTREGVEVTIRNGRDTQPPMPAFEGRLTDQDMVAVIAYLDSLPVGPRNFGPGDGGMMGGGGMDGGMMGGGIVMLLVALLVLALVVLAVAVTVWLVRQGRGRGPVSGTSSPAREELDRRYAAGELSRDEYLQGRHDLESPPSATGNS